MTSYSNEPDPSTEPAQEATPEPVSPTAPSAQTEAALVGAELTETAPEAEDPDALKPGDDLPADQHPHAGSDGESDGYDRVVVSTDGSSTEFTEAAEAAKADEPVVRK